MKYRVGIDLGTSAAKLAVFEGRGEKARLNAFYRLAVGEEGILDEAELYAAVKGLLEEHSLMSAELVWGIPEYLMTAKIVDFPAKARNAELDKLVAMETNLVSGISDESFIHGYMVMKPGFGRQQPVLIAMTREDAVRSRLEVFEQRELPASGLAPAGLALAAAATRLIGGLAEEKSPVMLLDIGQENTTVVMMAGGQVIYLGTLMFNAGNFMSAAKTLQAERPGAGHLELKEFMAGVNIADETAQSPLRQAGLVLESELQGAVEHWRSQETGELAEAPVMRVYVCGGGSRLGGLCKWLSDLLECEVTVFGPEDNGAVRPELTEAYGLGLMASESTPYALSLMPQEIVQKRQRQRRWPFLAAAVCIFFAFLFGNMFSGYLANVTELEELDEKNEFMEDCLRLAKQRGESMDELAQLDAQVVYLFAPASRGFRLERTLEKFANSGMKHGWLVYLADEETAAGTGDFMADASKHGEKTIVAEGSNARRLLMSLGTVKTDHEFVCGGFVPMTNREEVSSLMKYFGDDDTLFAGVDRADGLENRASLLVWKWREYLNRNEKRLAKDLKLNVGGAKGPFFSQFELFTLKLPVAKQDFREGVSGRGKAD